MEASSKKITVMIADDEPLSREELSRLIGKNKDFHVVELASHGQEALDKLKKNPADVIFLDIDMPGVNGLEAASRLSQWAHPPMVVFATAYHQYAVEAFEENAVDYILKPYEQERLEKTLKKIQKFLVHHRPEKEKLVALEDNLIQRGIVKKLVGHKKNSKDRMVIEPAEVLYFYVEYSEIRARLAADEVIINGTLKQLLDQLDPAHFAQTHKSYIMNLNKMSRVTPMFNGNFEILLKDHPDVRVPLSRRYARILKGRLGAW